MEHNKSGCSNVFVYGTLLSGERNHDYFLQDSTCLGTATLNGYDMYDLSTYPGIVPGSGRVKGEVYEVSEETMRDLDYLEGEGSLYIRRQAEVTQETGEVILAYIYVYNHSISGYKRIPENLQPYTVDWENRDQATK